VRHNHSSARQVLQSAQTAPCRLQSLFQVRLVLSVLVGLKLYFVQGIDVRDVWDHIWQSFKTRFKLQCVASLFPQNDKCSHVQVFGVHKGDAIESDSKFF